MARTANRPTRQAALQRRRTEAQERQAVYDNLTDAQKAKRNPSKFPPQEDA